MKWVLRKASCLKSGVIFTNGGSSMMRGMMIVLLTVCISMSAMAQDRDTTKQELTNFDRFLDSHAAIKQDLSRDPSLVNNAGYLSNHPELKEFLGSHPGVREE